MIRDLRWIGIAEGISFLVLLLIAMPMKYKFGNPEPVRYTGSAHGFLFVVYILAVLRTAYVVKWNYKRTLLFIIASFLPLATLILDSNLRREQKSYSGGSISGN